MLWLSLFLLIDSSFSDFSFFSFSLLFSLYTIINSLLWFFPSFFNSSFLCELFTIFISFDSFLTFSILLFKSEFFKFSFLMSSFLGLGEFIIYDSFFSSLFSFFGLINSLYFWLLFISILLSFWLFSSSSLSLILLFSFWLFLMDYAMNQRIKL